MSRHNVSEEGHIPGERKVIGTPHPLLQQSRPTTHLPQILSQATGNVPANSAPRESSTREKSKLGHRSGAPSRGTELEAGPPSRALKRTFLAWPSSSEDFQLLNAFLPSSNSAAPTHLEVSRHGSPSSTHAAGAWQPREAPPPKQLHEFPLTWTKSSIHTRVPFWLPTTFSPRSPAPLPHSP